MKPLPFRDPGSLVVLRETDRARGSEGDDVTPSNFEDWRSMSGSFEALAALVETSQNLTGEGEPERLEVVRVSASLFPLLGIEAALGRVFLPEEHEAGAPRVVLLARARAFLPAGASPR